jgi:hypothetical protein
MSATSTARQNDRARSRRDARSRAKSLSRTIPSHVAAFAFFVVVLVAGFRDRDRERDAGNVARVARRRTPRSSDAAMSRARL